jgi:hypothetical protein
MPVLNYILYHGDIRGSEDIAPPFLISALNDDDWSASRPGRFTPDGKPRFPLYRRLGGPQSRSGRCGVENYLLPLPGIEPWTYSP